jgi:hypothetical protein
MNVKHGLAMGAKGKEVAALHDALTVIGLQIDVSERDKQSFGASTVAAVIKLQVLAGVEQTGVLDENTTAVLSFALDRLGVSPGEEGFTVAAAPYAVSGTVTDTDGLPLVGAAILAFDCDLRTSKEIGSRARTDETGAYRIPYKVGELLEGHTAADLRVEAQDDSGKTLLSSPITFIAQRQTAIDLALGGPTHAQPSELTSLISKVTPLLGKLTAAELEESSEHQDLSFIVGQTGVIRERLGYWTTAARLATTTELPVEFFYGLFRGGVPADAHVTVLASSTQGIDLAENAQRLLEGVLSTSTTTITAAIANAITGNLIPASYEARSASDVARVATLSNNAALTSTQGFGKTSFASVLGAVAVEPDAQERFIELYTTAVGSARRTFWNDLHENSSFTPEQVSSLRFGVLTGRLTRGYMPLIEELATQRSSGQIKGARDLARLTAADWGALLEKQQASGTPIGVPSFIDAQTPQLARETYSSMLERFFTRTYPTTAFSARIVADMQSPFAAAAPTAAFLEANAAFDLRYTNIDAFANKTTIPPEVLPTLLAAQRLIKVNSDYTVMSALMTDGLQSAQQIYSMGRERFLDTYASLPALGATEAARTWARAEQTYAVALALAMKFNATLGAASPAAIGGVLPDKVDEQVAAFPNLQTLFGSESLCECEECQSVLGDGAYLADILDFLAQREASGKTTVRDVLLQRRPDIAQIELDCPNTDTALPYIDLVNELLEEAVAPAQAPETAASAARKRQTTLSTPELNANPEYVNKLAYEKLATAVYPWTLPFDLPLAEARAYLGQLNLSRAQLIATFQKPAGYPSAQAEALASEQLGLSALQADIITAGPLAAGFKSWEYWGLAERGNSIVDPDDPTKTLSGSWIELLSQARVLLDRAALDYEELARLLNTIFINGDGAVKIVADPPGSCDVATMSVEGLTQDVLDRIHRFVRLERCLGWSSYDLDNAIASLRSTTPTGLPQLNAQLLRQLAGVVAAMKRYSLSVPSAVALFAPSPSAVTIATREIPTLPGDEEEYSLYHELFENLTVLNPPDEVFALNAEGSEILAATATPAPKLAEHGPALVAAFQISEGELTLAIEKLTNGQLTLANLSTLYRNVELASALEVTIAELIELLAIAEAPAETATSYEPVEPFDGTRPESLETFAGLYMTLVASGLSIEQVDYLVRGVQDSTGVAPEPVAVGTLLLTLYNGLVKISSENAPAPDPTGTRTRKALSTLLLPADLNTAMTILEGTTTLSAAEQESFITDKLGSYIDANTAREQLVGPTPLQAGGARFEYILQGVLAYEARTLSSGLIVQSLAQALGLGSATAALLVGGWFPSATTPGAYAISDFLELAEKKLSDTTAPISPEDGEFAPYFATYASLAKAALLITTLKLDAEDVKWWQTNGLAAGWLDPTTLPASPEVSAEGRFYRLYRLIAACNVRSAMPVANATFAKLFAAPGTSKSDYLTQLATASQWQAATLEVLCGDPASDADLGELSLAYPKDYESEVALSRLLACERVLTQTGIPAELSSWIAATLESETANEIKQSVKANYPESEWLTLAKQLRDPLRQAQRDALVSYLLANEPPAGVSSWLNPDDVFAHFLIDVEMCSCMATSRMVQATASVQLFVQRCFLNLEPKVTVDVSADSYWLQWQWMGQYRVWQANREVFLFPENWIDPTRRADASPFFADLQQDLKQGELGSEVAETALQNYLEKLEAVARLDVCGVFHDMEKGEDVLRVLARTQGSPPVYYMRKWVDSSLWTAWEKVELDINSDHVLPIVWNGRQYIFWAIVTVKADQHGQPLPVAKVGTKPPPPPNVHLEVQLAWSQFKQGKWQAKQTAPQTLVFAGPWPAESTVVNQQLEYFLRNFESTDITLKSSFNGSLLEIDVFLDEVKTFEDAYVVFNSPRTHVGAFVLGGAGSGVEAFVTHEYHVQLENVGGGTPVDQVGELNGSILKPAIATPAETSFYGDWLANLNMKFQSATRPRVGPMNTSYQLYHTLPSEMVLKQADYYQLITPHQLPTFDSTLPFFYRDSAREYFIVPTNYYQNGNYFTINAPEYVYDPFFKAEYTFWPFYHPFVSLLVGQLNIGGIDALYAQKIQLDPAGAAGLSEFNFGSYYEPTGYVLEPYPKEAIDFEPNAGYSLYNWELFFHAPFLIANALRTNQNFELAKEFYEYVFNPASGNTDSVPQRFWVTKPFYEMSAEKYAEEQITALMEGINHRNPTLEHQVALWRAEPFDPDAIAQMRPVAYQRAIVMQYIDNLIAWGDQLFTQDTMETINLATQLYVLAADLLGPRPEVVPPLVEPVVKTYSELESNLDAFSNALVAAENAIPPVKVNVPTPEGSPSLPSLSTLYFQIPPNSQLLGYWDTVADRLFKIRHCMNIEGVVQQLPLFSPPINPALLVAATAAGLDLTSVLSDSGAALPPYRFRIMIRHALELCDQVRSLGAELLAALEKSDAEELSRIRSGGEINLQSAIDEVRKRQIASAKQEIEVLAKAKQAYLDRESFYVNRSLTNEWEALALVLRATALIPQGVAIVADGAAAVAHAFPSIEAGVAGAGGSPTANVKIGGPNVGHAADKVGWVARMAAAVIQTGAELSATMGQYHQRQDDWTLQGTVAKDEIARIEAERVAAEIRVEVASKEKEAQDVAVENAHEVDTFLHEKFTNKELYDWMVSQTSTSYFQAYQLAYSTAKAAEQCFARELAIAESDYIQFGYWDSLHQGLTAGEKLHYDLRRLESAYFTQNDRELEIVKHVSLLQLDPYALVELRETGSCLIDLPEILFDLDNPGHYMRRIKTVGLTVPCVGGPFTSVSATLTLLGNQIRVSPASTSAAEYPRKSESDERFVEDPGGAEIVTSSAQGDSGLFERRFEDERYLPFEGAGAVSSWRVTLNNVYPQFDYTTITDIVLHLHYTARDGGMPLREVAKSAAKSSLNKMALAEEGRTGLYRLFSARHEFRTNWARFLNPAPGADQILTLETPPERFPFFTNGLDLKVRSLDVLARTSDANPYTLVLSTPASETQTVTLSPDSGLDGMQQQEVVLSPSVNLGRAPTPSTATPLTWTIKLKQQSASDFQSLVASDIEDILLVVSYQVSE